MNSLMTDDAEGVQTVVSYDSGADKYDVALFKGSTSDSKSITMTVSEAADPDIATVAAAFNAVDCAALQKYDSRGGDQRRGCCKRSESHSASCGE